MNLEVQATPQRAKVRRKPHQLVVSPAHNHENSHPTTESPGHPTTALYQGGDVSKRTKESKNNDEPLSKNVLIGLTVAGVAQALLTTIFRLFHVDVFLQSYHLPLPSYSSGSFIISIITTFSSVVAAWMVDHAATKYDRTEAVGQTGFYFVACFLTPFFGFFQAWATLHFVVSVSLYQTLYSYMAILLGSIVTDSHNMTQQKRAQFMASGKAVNLLLSFVVARVGLSAFEENNLHPFRVFLAALAAVTLFLFALAQSMIQGTWLWRRVRRLRRWRIIRIILYVLLSRSDNSAVMSPTNGNDNNMGEEQNLLSSAPTSGSSEKPRKLQWRRVVADFRCHHNFRVWVVMEMLLHAQINFNASFLKTFVDHLLVNDFGRDVSDWLLSLVWPMTQIVTIAAYFPIQRWGYSTVYLILFMSNFVLSNVLLWLVGPDSSYATFAFLTVYSISTRAVQSAGFHLAMADMVLEMKQKHAKEGRYDEPSMAGLFMGANALLCKPVESILPMIAASVMEAEGESRRSLFRLLVWPPLVCSVIQMIAWTSFDLTPKRTATMRRELQEHQSNQNSNNGFIDMLGP